MDPIATIIMTIALLFYTIGVWSEKFQGKLSYKHLFLFALGLLCDTWGTGIMFGISEGISLNFHGIAGLVAIVLMFLHAIWATVVLLQNQESKLKQFHRYSIMVWLLWLVPYLSPVCNKLTQL